MNTNRIATALLSLCTIFLLSASRQTGSVIWKVDNTSSIGNHQPVQLGHPVAVQDGSRKAVRFNGVDDGLVLPVNPLEKKKAFTVEVLFKPAADGPPAPRFVHMQDSIGNRCTLELRFVPGGRWYADTFLRNGKTEKGLTLIDSTLQHPCGQWSWLALVYDGSRMSDYVNGVKESEGDIALDPMLPGQISLGVRLNRVNWFKGQIAEVRIHDRALRKEDLQVVRK
ncbi:MAG: LamG domain-containing protein [Williamsia sp.]|nr:LamG domain-containing protein [Williamsia sp.]